MRKEEILRKIKKEIIKNHPSATIILYGSRARGDYNEYSDWDFLILLEKNLTEIQESQIRDEIYDLELESGEVFCSIIHSKREWENLQITPFFQNVEREGIVL